MLIDSSGTSDWTVRLMSGSGIPGNNTVITSDGTLSFWMKTSTANTGATMQVWFDDVDGNEVSPALSVINDGLWHLYNFNLDNLNGTSVTTGNGQLDAATVTLDAIVLKQPNTSSAWTVDFDDVMHVATGTNPGTSAQIPKKEAGQTQKLMIGNAVIYPNPNNGSFHIVLPLYGSEEFRLQVISSNGKVVFSKQVYGGEHVINVGRLPPGLYIVDVRSSSLYTTSKILVY